MIPVLIFGGAAAAVTIAGVLTGFGLAAAASAMTASQNGQFLQMVLEHQRRIEQMRLQLHQVQQRPVFRTQAIQIQALYRQAILAGDQAWMFMNETRNNLNHLWDAIRQVETRIPYASSEERYRLIEVSRELRITHTAMRQKLLGLKDNVRRLNHHTHSLKNQLSLTYLS